MSYEVDRLFKNIHLWSIGVENVRWVELMSCEVDKILQHYSFLKHRSGKSNEVVGALGRSNILLHEMKVDVIRFNNIKKLD